MRLYSVLVALDGDGRRASDERWGLETDTQTEPYDVEPAGAAHRRRLLASVGVAAATAVGVAGWWPVAVAVGVLTGVISRTWRVVVLAVLLAVVGGVRGEQAWGSLEPARLGAFEGWVRLVDDPQPFTAGTRLVLDVEGERFESWIRRRGSRARVESWRGGHRVLVAGVRSRLDPERARRVAWQHVVGGFDVDWASDVDPGGPVDRASNRVRSAIERAGEQLPDDDGALFRGLVVGDDRDQPPEMLERFRASGLSHLTAVSGQNVSFLLAAAGPLLRRVRPWSRWAVTIGLIAWFVALTRFEPSIIRAGVMAGLSATAFVLGRDRAPIRILAVSVIGLVLFDPLLVWSIGFWLSVGATLGVSAGGPWIADRLRPFDPTRLFALPLGVTLGAQLGVVVPSVLVFGRLPLVSVPANLLAVPVAGAVMLYGLPAGLVAGWVPVTAPVLMFPIRLGTRWVDTVALVGARAEPGPAWQIGGWSAIALAVLALAVIRLGRLRADARIARHTAERHGDFPADR